MVVALPPLLDHDACFLHGWEFFAVQAFVSELAVEALDVTILPRASRLDVRRAYIDRFKEPTHSTCDEFRTIVASNELWNSSDREQVNQHVNEVATAQLPGVLP